MTEETKETNDSQRELAIEAIRNKYRNNYIHVLRDLELSNYNDTFEPELEQKMKVAIEELPPQCQKIFILRNRLIISGLTF